MADLDYVYVVGRFGIAVADGGDPDDDPDTVWCDTGTISLEPQKGETKVAGGLPVPWTGGQSIFKPTIDAEGFLTWHGQHFMKVVDLTSDKVNPRVVDGKATHGVRFDQVKAGDQTVTFEQRPVRLSADMATALDATAAAAYGLPTGTLVCDLTDALPVPVANSVPIVVGPQGPPGDPTLTDEVTATNLSTGDLTKTALATEISTTGTPAEMAVTANQLAGLTTPGDPRREAVGHQIDASVPAVPAVSPKSMAVADHPVFVRKSQALLQHSATGFPSLYWINVYYTGDIEGAPGPWCMTYSTDHDSAGTPEPFNGKGGIGQAYSDTIDGTYTPVKSGGVPVIFQDTVAGNQTETPSTVRDDDAEIQIGATLAVTTAGVITAAAHGMPNGQYVRVTAKVSADGFSYRSYYVVQRTASTFKLSLTKGGPAVTSSNSGTLAVTAVGCFNHYYQQQGVGENQSTLLARSFTGHISDWKRVGIVIKGDPLLPGDGQATYAVVQRIAGGWVAYHLFGGGNYSGAGISFSVDGLTWKTDPRRMYSKDLSGDPTRKVSMSPKLFRWRGDLWGLGGWSFYGSGFQVGDRPWWLARITEDLRGLRSKPIPCALDLATGETDSTSPNSVVAYGGKLYGFYRSNGQYGAVRVAIAEA